MQEFHFIVRLEHHSEITDELERAVLDAGCEDALLAQSGSRVFLEFDRDAASLYDAVVSALRDLQRAGIQ